MSEEEIKREVLVALRWASNANWLIDAPMEYRLGVAVDYNGRFIQLLLRKNQLSGPIPPEPGRLFCLARPGSYSVARNLLKSGAGDLTSTITRSSIASMLWGTSSGCRQTSPGPTMLTWSPTVARALPRTM